MLLLYALIESKIVFSRAVVSNSFWLHSNGRLSSLDSRELTDEHLRDIFALSKSYAAASSMRFMVKQRRKISFFWLAHWRARSAEPSLRFMRENRLSACQRWP